MDMADFFVRESMLIQFIIDPEDGQIQVWSKGARKSVLNSVKEVGLLTLVWCSVTWIELLNGLYNSPEEHVYFTGQLDATDDVVVQLQLFDGHIVATVYPFCSRESATLLGNALRIGEDIIDERAAVSSGVGVATIEVNDLVQSCDENFATTFREVLGAEVQRLVHHDDISIFQDWRTKNELGCDCEVRSCSEQVRLTFVITESREATYLILFTKFKQEHGVLYAHFNNDGVEELATNPKLYTITGCSRDDLLSYNSWFNFLQPEAPSLVRRTYEMHKQSKNGWTMLLSQYIPRWIELEIYVYNNEEVWLLTDISDRIFALDKFRIYYERSPHDVYLLAINCRIVDCNDAAVHLFQYENKCDLLGLSPDEFSAEKQQCGRPSGELIVEVNRLVREKGTVRFEWIYKTADGQCIPTAATLTSGVLGGSHFIMVMLNDLTAIKDQQRQLSVAKDLAQQSSEAKARFLANMSHEIRTPMNGVMGVTELLLKTSLSSEQRSHLDTIRSCGNSLMRMLEDVLDLSKLEVRNVYLEDIDFTLSELVSEVYTSFETVASDKGLELQCCIEESVPELVKGDPVRVRQVLFNLISNSIKYTDSGRITLNVRMASLDDSQGLNVTLDPHLANLYFEVRDTGIGVDSETREHIFDAFFQGNSRTSSKYGGALAISKYFINLMGGNIDMESRLESGSTFFFIIKVAKNTEINHDMELLVVEDDRVNRMVVLRMLRNMEFTHIDWVENGLQALSACAEKEYDFILMDCYMPEMDGYEATRGIRSLEESCNRKGCIIVALTASGNGEAKCRKAGMDGYLTKPINSQELTNAFQRTRRNTNVHDSGF